MIRELRGNMSKHDGGAFSRRAVLVGGSSVALPLALRADRLLAQEQPQAGATTSLFEELEALSQRADKAGIALPTRKVQPGEAATYSEMMPRLVDLMEKAGQNDELAETAAELLSRVNASERGVQPEDDSKAPPAFSAMEKDYREQYGACQILTPRLGKVEENVAILLRNRPRYETVAASLNIPWYFIGIIHGLEASFNFKGHLHNGDYPLTRRTVQVPAGRPPVWNPPTDWEASAADALQMKGFDKETDWSLPQLLYRWERYNGFGYYWRNTRTPYLWSFSNQYSKGKYVSDGRWDPNYVSQQCGAAPMLQTLVTTGVVTLPA
jgi:lysozyme family protein